MIKVYLTLFLLIASYFYAQEEENKEKQIPPHSVHLASQAFSRLEVKRGLQFDPGTEIVLWVHHRVPVYPMSSSHINETEVLKKMLHQPLVNAGFAPKFEKFPLSESEMESLSRNFKTQITLNLLQNAEEWKRLKPPSTSGMYGYVFYKEGLVPQEGPLLLRASVHLFVFTADGEFAWSFQDPGTSPIDGVEVKVPEGYLARKEDGGRGWKIKLNEKNLRQATINVRKVFADRWEKFFKPYRYEIVTARNSDLAVGVEITLDSESQITGVLLRENTESITITSPNYGKVDIKKDYILTIRRRELTETLGDVLEKFKTPD